MCYLQEKRHVRVEKQTGQAESGQQAPPCEMPALASTTHSKIIISIAFSLTRDTNSGLFGESPVFVRPIRPPQPPSYVALDLIRNIFVGIGNAV